MAIKARAETRRGPVSVRSSTEHHLSPAVLCLYSTVLLQSRACTVPKYQVSVNTSSTHTPKTILVPATCIVNGADGRRYQVGTWTYTPKAPGTPRQCQQQQQQHQLTTTPSEQSAGGHPTPSTYPGSTRHTQAPGSAVPGTPRHQAVQCQTNPGTRQCSAPRQCSARHTQECSARHTQAVQCQDHPGVQC